MDDIHPNIKSRTIKTLIRCPVCDKPIGERLGNRWWFMNKQGHEVLKTPFELGQKTPHGSYEVSCPDEECGGAHIFAWFNEQIGITDKVGSKVISVDKSD